MLKGMDFAAGRGFLQQFDMFAVGGVFDRTQGNGGRDQGKAKASGPQAAEAEPLVESEATGLKAGDSSASVSVDRKGAVHTTFPSLDVIQASIARYQQVAGRARSRRFVNPQVIARFPVEKGGPRQTIFGALVKHCKLLYADLDKAEELPSAIAATEARIQAARDKHPTAKGDNPTLTAQLDRDQKALAKATAAIAEREAALEGLIAEAQDNLRRHMEGVIKKAQAAEAKANGAVDKAQARLDASVASGASERRQKPLKAGLDKVRATQASALLSLENAEKLLAEADELELLVMVQQQEWTITYGEGKSKESYGLASPVGGINTDRPDGYRHGGGVGFTEKDFDHATNKADIGLKGDARAKAMEGAKKTLEAIRRHEGSSDSVNTWDRAVLTFGPGLAAFGVLESVFAKLAIVETAFYSAEVASLGIGVNGKVFTAKDATTGKLLRGQAAKEYIANSPVLLGAMRRICGAPEVRRQMVVRTFETSIKRALTWTVTVDGPEAITGQAGKKSVTIAWAELTNGVDSSLVGAAQTVVASFYHASGNSQKLQSLVAEEVRKTCKATGKSVRELLEDESSTQRSVLVQMIVNQVRDDTWAKAINDTMDAEIAPMKPKPEGKKK